MSADQFLTLEGRPTVRVAAQLPASDREGVAGHHDPRASRPVVPEPGRARPETGWGDPLRRLERRCRIGRHCRDRGRTSAPRVHVGYRPVDVRAHSGDDGTTFSLTHSFDDRYGAASFATGWEFCLAGLRSVLAGDPLPPPDRGVARHEELVHEFGLDRPEMAETDGRWTVRVERQLTCPAEVAWDLWFGRDRDTGEQRSAPAVGQPLTPYMAPDVVIGTMTEVDLHRVLAFDVAPTGGPGEHLRLEFADGTGHGVRVILTVTGTDPGERDAAAEMWGTSAIGHLAASAAAWATAQPVQGRP